MAIAPPMRCAAAGARSRLGSAEITPGFTAAFGAGFDVGLLLGARSAHARAIAGNVAASAERSNNETPVCGARSASSVAARGQDKHLHYSRGVTVEEMRQASMALMQLVPTEPTEVEKVGTSVGTSTVGTGNRMGNGLQLPGLSH
jgi:hypothetical protein